MQDIELYRQILGVEYPWEVSEVDLNQPSRQVTIHLQITATAELHCPECGRVCPGYDHRDRQWRHLDSCEFTTILTASVPRVRCPEHGVRQLPVPWAEAGSGYTVLFESLVIDWLRCASTSEVARLMRLSWNAIDRIEQRAVSRGLQRRESRSFAHLSIDEIAVKKGHAYVTVISDQSTGGVIEVLEDRKKETLTRFFAKLSHAERASVETVSMDMWPAYIGAVEESIPEAEQKICYDRFHIAEHLNRAIDRVRRSEHRTLIKQQDERLKKTRYLWLQNPDAMSDQRWDEFASLRTSRLKTARAWVLKEEAMGIFTQAESQSEARHEWQWWYNWAIRSRIEPIKKVARMIKRHLCGIINAIVHRRTNALAESINAAISKLKRRAHGYRNTDRLRTAILFHRGKRDLYPRAKHKLVPT